MVGDAVQQEARILLGTLLRLTLGPDGRDIIAARARASRGARRQRRPPPNGRQQWETSVPRSVQVQSTAVDGDPDASLHKALAHGDPSVRVRALDVVSTFSAQRAERYLAVLMWDPDPDVRRAATTACARLATPRTVSALILALDDPNADVRKAAAASLHVATGKVLPAAVSEDASRRNSVVAELKAWWKQERYSELSQSVVRSGRGERRARER